MKKFLGLLFLIPALLSFGNEDYLAIVDIDFSPYMGAEDLISLHNGIERLERSYIYPICPPRKNVYEGFTRLAELSLFWDPYNRLSIVTQHEVFGHGFRVRSIGKKYVALTSYTIDAPPPYGMGGGSTGFNLSSKASSTQYMAISMAGVESTAILGQRIKMHWLAEGKLRATQASLYLEAQQDLTNYALSKDDGLFNEETSHDMHTYLHILSRSYPHATLKSSQLRRRALVNLLDPFTYYSIYAWWRYIISGKNSSIPMIPIRGYRYLPGARLGLTPFGTEYFIENFLVKNCSPIYFYIKWGNFAKNHYYGLGIEDPEMVVRSWCSLGFRLDLWSQPKIPMHRIPIEEFMQGTCCDIAFQKPRFGGAFSLIGSQKSFLKHISTYEQIGYKSAGFLPGESLESAPIVRVGLLMHF